MTKRITYALADTPPADPPVVASLHMDSCKDVKIVLTRGDERLELGYLCSDNGTLFLYNITAAAAAKFGIVRDESSFTIKVE